MKKIIISSLLIGIMLAGSGCKKWLDVNKSPNAPDIVAANLYLGPMTTYMVTGGAYDGRYVGKYVQFWRQTSANDTYDRMGPIPAPSDAGGEIWKVVYWQMGYNLIDMMNISEKEQRWDLLGIGYLYKAWGWLQVTQFHSDLIIKQAFDNTRKTFDYDNQEYAYTEIFKLLDKSIELLNRTDGAVNASYIAPYDNIYQGNREKWLKFAHGLKAMALNHFSNKASYNPDAIISEVDMSFTGNADDAKYKYVGRDNGSKNFLSPDRGNFTSVRTSEFFVNILNGTDFSGVLDPRLKRLVFPDGNGNYNGANNDNQALVVSGNLGLKTIWGTVNSSGLDLPGNYVFNAKSSFPMMTYAQLQFIKAEAAFKKGDKTTALDAYKKGVSAHIDFVNTANAEAANPAVTAITASEKTTYMNSAAVNMAANDLKLGDIMLQKYVAQWGWAFAEQWTDLRRYHYTDKEPGSTTEQVFRNFEIPGPSWLFTQNLGKPVYRLKPRYNSEYVWNIETLKKIGGDKEDYHTYEMWIFQP